MMKPNPGTGEVEWKYLGSYKNCLEGEDALKNKFSGIGALSTNGRNAFQLIPCGHCIGCRKDYARSWADRLTYHSFDFEGTSWFFTLTYSEDFICDLPYSENYGLYSLNFDHMTEFIKTLRNRNPGINIDYFYSGEYGSTALNTRPHFHMILYGLSLPDLQYWKCNDHGDPIYTSDYIDSIWKKGFVTISPFSWAGAAYTAGYVLKKLDGRRLNEYTAVGLEPERARCSRRPGIAHDFYLYNAEYIWSHDGFPVDRSVNSTGKLGIPRYFQRLADKYRCERKKEFEMMVEWKKASLDRSCLLNPLKIDNSSFDLDRIDQMLAFEEREVLRDYNPR